MLAEACFPNFLTNAVFPEGQELGIFLPIVLAEGNASLRGWEVRVFFLIAPPEEHVPLRGVGR